ncbi:MAG: HAD-IC family P-type ATPase [Kiloniellales bacterium]|nr:HAD-IC family P-type ATPase [Kiloniellales bacterium]
MEPSVAGPNPEPHNPADGATVAWHAMPAEAVLSKLDAREGGLSTAEAKQRRARFGPNRLPRPRQPGALRLYLRQFKNPLVYLLLLATLVSLGVGEMADALFIFVVLQFNAAIGALQEWKAQRSAAALDALIREVAVARRDGVWVELDAEDLVPGDVVKLESGARIAADLRLLDGQELRADESLLTGESVPVGKVPDETLAPDLPAAERRNQLFAGATLLSGRALGVVVGTGRATEIGRIAQALVEGTGEAPPLVRRLEHFGRVIGLATLVMILVLATVQILQGLPMITVFLVAVALAVAAIPEGLPVAITVALAIATNRMLRRKVIVRALPAVEGLGACTVIATDKTGTLTQNELTVKRLLIFDDQSEPLNIDIAGSGYRTQGAISHDGAPVAGPTTAALEALAVSAALCNEASLRLTDDGPVHLGDTVDVAFLVLAAKLGLDRDALRREQRTLARIPYEPQHRFAAAYTATSATYTAADPGRAAAHLKGAAEVILPRCRDLDQAKVMAAADSLAAEGFRVLAVARGEVSAEAALARDAAALQGLELLGIAGLIDPVRPEVPAAVAACRDAGISVRMVTGDHPQTALAIARELGLASEQAEVVTGRDLQDLETSPAQFDRRVAQARVFARVEPVQKLAIVDSLHRADEVVAVTGDGVNDAPALSAAAIGVAMGRGGTDVARGAADLVLTDDNFASIVGGIEEGRIAYDNVRKLIYLLITTGLGEIVLFLLAILAGLPVPLFAAQLLWLNLVTNGIQDVALAFEKGEPEVLKRRPRPPDQAVFDRRMVAQVLVAGSYMGGVAFAFFLWCLERGMSEAEARNLLLLLMVMFENAHAMNARSERRSVFQIALSANWFLVAAVIGAHGLHLLAGFAPGLAGVLEIQPIALSEWALVGVIALSLVLVMELYKRLIPRSETED